MIGAAARLDGHKSFFFKFTDGFPDRRPADSHLFGKLHFHHPGTWDDSSCQDLHFKFFIDHLAERSVVLYIEIQHLYSFFLSCQP